MTKRLELPSQQVTVDSGSQVNPIWFEKFKAMADFVGLFDVDVKALTNGQVLIWDATTKKFKPGSN